MIAKTESSMKCSRIMEYYDFNGVIKYCDNHPSTKIEFLSPDDAQNIKHSFLKDRPLLAMQVLQAVCKKEK